MNSLALVPTDTTRQPLAIALMRQGAYAVYGGAADAHGGTTA